MLTKDFWYDLPPERIAQEPVRPRDHSKLMILDCRGQQITHRYFYHIADYLNAGDLLVVNDSKVFRARLRAKRGDAKLEIFLLRPEGEVWLALARPGKKLAVGDQVDFEGDVHADVVQKNPDGTVEFNFNIDNNAVFAYADKYGQVPTPPYVKQAPADADDYQTIYAKQVGSVAAPTAGFHFTPELMEKLREKGVHFASVTLHVGLGTFRPVMTENVEDHAMHSEWIEVPRATAELVNETHEQGGRVIAVGTTSVRSLEAAARQLPTTNDQIPMQAFSGFTDLFIKPGDEFKVVDAMITNFHLPESTLIMLVSAFAQSKMQGADQGRNFVLKSYQEAINNDYRFYSFGDGMLIN
ncbi:MAG: tRNA preQ1(34) S-adenosylmethionine ribosyltransferase-isomerase QueA [Patescibacteria group bacterium]